MQRRQEQLPRPVRFESLQRSRRKLAVKAALASVAGEPEKQKELREKARRKFESLAGD